MAHIKQGLLIAVTGMGGVFAGLIVLMLLVMAIGAVFGKKPPPKKSDSPKSVTDEKKAQASAKPAEAQKDG